VSAGQRRWRNSSGNDLARLLEESDEDLIDFALKFQARAILGYLLTPLIHLKRAETHKTRA